MPTPWLAQLLSAIPSFDWGAFGVAVFFLVSGFVIPISLNKYSVKGFLIGRIFRIWPTYIAGFTVTVLTIWLAGKYFGKSYPYSARELAIHYVPGLRDLLWSTNIDGVIWTLEIEVKFYVVCALGAVLIRRESAWLFALPVALGAACMLATGYLDAHGTTTRPAQLAAALTLSGQFIVYMFIGTAVAFAMNRSFSIRTAALIGSGLVGLFVWLVIRGPWRGIHLPLGAYGAALLIFLLAACLWRPRSGNSVLRFLANISYPLYAAHIAMGYVAIAVTIKLGGGPTLGIALAFLLTITMAWFIHRFVEAPTHRLGQRLARRITTSRKTSADSPSTPAAEA